MNGGGEIRQVGYLRWLVTLLLSGEEGVLRTGR